MADEVIVIRDSRPYKSLITDIGNAKMTRAVLEGRKVNIVEMRLGDGGGSYYMPTTDATSLVNEVWRGEIASKTINEKSPNIIAVKTVIPTDVGGFTIREASLHDDEGDMIAVCNMPDIAKATLPDGISSSLDVVMNILLSNVDAVEFIINPTLDPASRDDLQQAITAHNADPNAHGGALASSFKVEITIPTEGWEETSGGGSGATGTMPDTEEEEPDDPREDVDDQREPSGLRVEIEHAAIKAAFTPNVTILPAYEDAAKACGLKPTARTMDGAIRFYAPAAPDNPIKVEVILTNTTGIIGDITPGGGGSGFTMQPATRTSPGVVIIGDGVDVDRAGKISVDGHGIIGDMAASKDDVAEVLDGIFGPKEG